MIDGYSAYLLKLKEIYPETYLKIIEFPDAVVIGWINEIVGDQDMMKFKHPEAVKKYFDMKVLISGVMLNTK